MRIFDNDWNTSDDLIRIVNMEIKAHAARTHNPWAVAPIKVIELAFLYHPITLEELKLIEETGYSRYPDSSVGRAFKYPFLTVGFTRSVAKDFKIRDFGTKHVSRCAVPRHWLEERFEALPVPDRKYVQYVIPAHRMWEFNERIFGNRIEVIDL